MKKNKYFLIIMFIAFRLLAVGQQKTDSLQQADSLSKLLTSKEFRNEMDSQAKSLVPMPGKAIVYIIRNNFTDRFIPYRIDCDSFQVGWFQARMYLYTILDPGDHVFISTAENEYHFKIKLEPGKIYYVELYYGIGIVSSVIKMKMLNEVNGRKDLYTCKISRHNRYPLFPLSKAVESFPPKED